MKIRFTLLTLLSAAALLLMPATAAAWSNGGNHGDGFGTHDWLLQEANRLAAKKDAGWVRLKVALPRTDDPDTVYHDFYYHVYDRWGSEYGNAPKKVAYWYGRALRARKAGSRRAASVAVAIMSHYYADICNPLHADQSSAEKRMHSSYEGRVQTRTDAAGENRSWVRFDGYTARTNVTAFTRRTAAARHTSYSTLVRTYNASGLNSTVMSITRKSLNRGANGLADLIISIKRRVGGGV